MSGDEVSTSGTRFASTRSSNGCRTGPSTAAEIAATLHPADDAAALKAAMETVPDTEAAAEERAAEEGRTGDRSTAAREGGRAVDTEGEAAG